MIRKTRHTLITAEIMGFFLIVIAILALLTNRAVFRIIAYIIFSMILIAAIAFSIFSILAVKEHERMKKPRKRK